MPPVGRQSALEEATLESATETVVVAGGFPREKDYRFGVDEVIFERFRVVRFIAAGGMGEVYEVEDRRLRDVRLALKTIRPDIAAKRDMQERFEREVLLARSVVHPNLCPIYDIFHCRHKGAELTFLTMKLLPGETLSSRLKREGVIGLEEAREIVLQVGAALTAAHNAGILHRDIKTANIMLDGAGAGVQAYVTDFGLARAYRDESTLLTADGVAGTPGYVAPELFYGEAPSVGSDVYAFGVVAYKMVTGKAPGALLSTGIEAGDVALSELPSGWQRMIEGCLQALPAKRCGSLAEALALLREESDQRASTSKLVLELSRRRVLGLGTAATVATAAGAWVSWPRINAAMHPLPVKRFVALLDWPTTGDARAASMIAAVVDAIGSELSRAEAYDSNLYIIPQHIGKGVTSLSQLNNVRESLGANLVLAATGASKADRLNVLLKVLDPAVSRTLRERTISVSGDDQLTLPERAVRVAAELLNIRRYEPDDARSKVGTSNAQAYAAFQTAESLMQQENDAGLAAAIENYKRAVELDPHFAVASAKLALAYFRSYSVHRDPAALVLARGNCESALAQNPKLVEARLAQASVMDWTGDKEGALREISKALALDPSHPRAMLFQGQTLTRLNRWKDAQDTFARLQAARPNYWLGHEERGIAYYSEGNYAKACPEFQAASLAAPKRTLPLANLAITYGQMGKFDDAIEMAKKALAIGADDEAELAWAGALRAQGKATEALAHDLKAVQINPDWAPNWLDLAESYGVMRSRKKEAQETWAKVEKMLETDLNDGPTSMLLALAQAKTGHKAESMKSVEAADRNYSGDLDSQLTKVRVLELLGKREEALAVATACIKRGANKFQFETMPDVDGLRNDPRFKKLLV